MEKSFAANRQKYVRLKFLHLADDARAPTVFKGFTFWHMNLRVTDDQYSKEEAQKRFMQSLRAAVNRPPKPLKSTTPKRPKTKLEKSKSAQE